MCSIQTFYSVGSKSKHKVLAGALFPWKLLCGFKLKKKKESVTFLTRRGNSVVG